LARQRMQATAASSASSSPLPGPAANAPRDKSGFASSAMGQAKGESMAGPMDDEPDAGLHQTAPDYLYFAPEEEGEQDELDVAFDKALRGDHAAL